MDKTEIENTNLFIFQLKWKQSAFPHKDLHLHFIPISPLNTGNKSTNMQPAPCGADICSANKSKLLYII